MLLVMCETVFSVVVSYLKLLFTVDAHTHHRRQRKQWRL